MQTLFGYQVYPGSDERLTFALTIEECRQAAKEQRRLMRAGMKDADIGAMVIYECLLRVDLFSLIEMLNNPDAAYRKLLASKILIELVDD